MINLPAVIVLLERGNWQEAHRIVQEDESEFGCWAHGIVHLMEGDEGNAAYWYRRAGRALPTDGAGRIEGEISALREAGLAA